MIKLELQVGIQFGLQYDIPELVEISTQWIKDHIKPSNFLSIVQMYDQILVHNLIFTDIVYLLQNFLDATPSHQTESALSSVIEYSPEWAQILGLDRIPVQVFRKVLNSGPGDLDPNTLCRWLCDAVEHELSRPDEELAGSQVFARLISPQFKLREFLGELAGRVTDMEAMRLIFSVERQFSQRLMSLATSSGSLAARIRECYFSTMEEGGFNVFL